MSEETIKMTVEELTAAMATEVMGWTRELRSCDSEWWSGPIGTYPEPLPIFLVDEWSPARDAYHRDGIVEKMRGLGWTFYLTGNLNEQGASFAKDKIVTRHKRNKNIGIAVMLAAYQAVTGNRVEVSSE